MHEVVMQKPTGRNLTLSSNMKPRKTQEGLSRIQEYNTGMQKAQEKVNQSLNVHLQS